MFTRRVLIDGEAYYEHRIISYTNNYEEGMTYISVRSSNPNGDTITEYSIPLIDCATSADLENVLMVMPAFEEAVDEASIYLDTILPFLTDEQAAIIPNAWPVWTADWLYEVGDRVSYGAYAYKCLQAHSSQANWNPVDAPSLWAKLLTQQSEEDDIPEWEQPSSTNPYMTGDKVVYNGVVYESLIDNNTWSPEAYPQGWRVVE